MPECNSYDIIRVKRGITPYDSCNLDSYISEVFVNGLTDLINFGGAPSQLTYDQWEEKLKKMRKGFEIYNDSTNYTTEERIKAVRKSLKLIRKWFPALWF